MVVGFQHIEGKTLADVAAHDRPFRLLLLGPLRARRRLLRGRPRAQGAAGRDAARDRGGRQRHRAPRRRARGLAHRRLPPGDDGSASASATSCWRTRATSCACTSGTARSRCSRRRAPSAWSPRARTQAAGSSRWSEGERGRQDHRPFQRHGDLHRQGHRVPALEAGQARSRLPLPAPPHLRRRAACCGRPPAARASPARPCSATPSAVYNVIDVGQSYPQRVVKAGVAALGHRGGRGRQPSPGLREGRALPATARALGYDVSAGRGHVKVSGRKGLGVKADDLIDALDAKARSEIASRDPERDADSVRAAARAIATGALRYFLLQVRARQDHHLRHGGGAGLHRRDRPLRPERRGARAQHLRQAGGGRAPAGGAAGARGRPGPRRAALGEEGGEVWSLLTADGAQRGGGRAGRAGGGGGARWPSTRSRWRRPSTRTTRSRSTRCSTPRARTSGPSGRWWWTRSCARWTILTDILGIPLPERM